MYKLKVSLSILALLACVAGCGLGEALRVTTIQVGRSLNADGTVAGHTTIFSPTDTVYVSVQTTGPGSGVIGVKWMYGTRVIGEPKKDVSYRDDAATEFHLQSAGGFPVGEYTVEAFFNGQSAGIRTFRVQD